ncbi:hypothetical protein MPSEU_000629800 [Mayamaea pseudoterrestris]|nr:hypothetical protein MPSEU_000629800 [Mayamaea pseudoterrestris]
MSTSPDNTSRNKSSSSSFENASTTETLAPTWTDHLPQAFGIREATQQSKYRWCFRESGLWGITSATAMALHRFRMGSNARVATHAGFGTLFLVYTGSYYFCCKRRDHQEKMIETMMRLNEFQHAAYLPETIPVDEKHPFAVPGSDSGESATVSTKPKQYVAHLPERKEWQSPLPLQDAGQVFRPVMEDEEDVTLNGNRKR